MDINLPEVKAEVEAAFARYETALMANDVDALQTLFWNSPHTIRYGIAEILHSWAEIGAFRSARPPVGLARIISRTVITTFGHDFATRGAGAGTPSSCLSLSMSESTTASSFCKSCLVR